jgi:hypothetical protein
MNQKPKNKISFIASDWNMIAVATSHYDSHAIALFKNCIGRVYDQAVAFSKQIIQVFGRSYTSM